MLSAARLADNSISLSTAATTILIAATANIVGKSAIAISAGGLRFGLPLAGAGIVALIVGLGASLTIGMLVTP
jgi:uncharacterized membrane protein (DUF4010 family)